MNKQPFLSTFFSTILLAVASLSITSCSLERTSHGNLYGMWHLEHIDTLATGGTCSLAKQRLFWSFQGRLLDLSDKDNNHRHCLARFLHQGDSLKLHSPYEYDREHGDKPLTASTLLIPYGIGSLQEGFRVESLSSSKLILRSKHLQLRLRKF